MSLFSDVTWWEIFLGGVCTLAIYSFLYKENSFYRFFEHFFIGISTSILVVQTIKNFMWPKIFKPMLGRDQIPFPDGNVAEPYSYAILAYLLPMALGLCYYLILTRRYAWVAQLAIGFGLGVSGGLAFKGFFNEVMPQLQDSFRTLYVPGDLFLSVSNTIFVITLVSSLFYFFFTFERKPGGIVERLSTTGRWMMMGCFGAFFGSTIMARMALLVERLQFLIETWWPTVFA